MSHVTKIKATIKDIDALKKGCARLGLEFRENKKTFNWWGTNVGDYREDGVDPSMNGKCEHAIALKGSSFLHQPDRRQPYEVGVCSNEDGTYSLKMDYFAGGNGIVNAVGGKTCDGLIQAYMLEVEKQELEALTGLGFEIQEQTQENGDIQLIATRSPYTTGYGTAY